jgi:thiol-disulfide isomerase/thioredoxin
MKKKSTVSISILILVGIFFLVKFITTEKSATDQLEKVLHNLEQIESASYFSTTESWNPGDTVATHVLKWFVKAYDNPSDTTIGASWATLNNEDTTHLDFAYDGKIRALIYNDIKLIVIDSFKVRKLPFRPVTPPFYNYTKNIIQYALETKDSVVIEQIDNTDHSFIRLTIYENEQVEFHGKAHHMPKPPFENGDPTSKYELWIDKSTNLPYKIRREMSHNISIESVSDSKFNKIKIDNFKIVDYFSADYEILQYGEKRKKTRKNKLLGKIAPDWELIDSDKKKVSLGDLNSKILLIQFTSVSCGPCRVSIPFLKNLTTEYNKNEFDLVCIESWNRNSNVLKQYQRRNKFNYKFLISTKEVIKSYQVSAVPTFFILDENRIIRKVIRGYGTDITDKEIRDAINELL